MRRTLTISEAAFALGVSKQTLLNLEKAGKLFCTRSGINGWRRYSVVEVDRLSKEIDGTGKIRYQKPTTV